MSPIRPFPTYDELGHLVTVAALLAHLLGWIDDQFYAMVTDLVGAPTELVDPNGTPAWRAHTTLWGIAVAPSPDGASCPLRFPGQYQDPETGLNYNYHRYYDPAGGRYESNDPLGLNGGPDPHTYVPNPINWFDPLGLVSCSPRASYTAQSARHSYTHGHAANSPRIPGKSRFRVTEGGQKFTDEVLGHPNVSLTHQANGRTAYEVPNLGRGPVGWDRYGNPAHGGRVIVEGPNPRPWSTYSPGEVVTQHPL